MLLGIYGAGGTGRMVHDRLEDEGNYIARYQEIVFIDDTPGKKECDGLRVVSFASACEAWSPGEIEYLIAVGDPAARKCLWEKIHDAGYACATWIHKDAYVSPSSTVAEGCIIDNCEIDGNVAIGANTIVYFHAVVGHDSMIGEHCVISVGSFIGGHSALHDKVFFGPCATCRDNIVVGEGAVVGINAAVYKDVPEAYVAIGNPARNMRQSGEGLFKS